MSDELLNIERLALRLSAGERSHAVQDVSLSVARGEVVCLIGESGSGKSSIAAAVMGLLPPGEVHVSAGRIQFEGKDLGSHTPEQMRALRAARIGMVFQEPMSALNPMLTVGQQIAEVFEAHGVPARERPAKVLDVMSSVGLPDPPRLQARYPSQLSGGQRQRVVIAMAVALKPALLIADEPTSALDVTTQAQILALIRGIQRERGMGVLFITHDFGVVQAIADRVVVMRGGVVVESGPVAQVLGDPRDAYTRQLVDAVPRFTPHGTLSRTNADAPLLQVRGLVKRFRTNASRWRKASVMALDDVSLELYRGEALGVIGESGSGKSTLGLALLRLIETDSGEILHRGTDLSRLSGRALRPHRRRIQIVFQDAHAALNPRHSAGRSIMAGPIAQGVSTDEAHQRALEMLQRVGLAPSSFDRLPHEFSGGQRQRIGIARALAVQPDVLVLDEAVSALDVSIQAQILALLRDIRDELGLAMLFITHDLRVASSLCHRLMVMHQGCVVEQGKAEDVLFSPQAAYTRSLLASVPGHGLVSPALQAFSNHPTRLTLP